MSDVQGSSVWNRLGVVKETMAVSRAFGDSYQADGVTIIPVATVRGGGGGGSGSGTGPVSGGGSGKDGGAGETATGSGEKATGSGEKATGSGAGLGFGAVVRPIGVFVIKDGDVSWRPVIDVMRIAIGAEIVALAAILTARRLRGRR